MCSEKINTSKNRSTAPMKSNLKGFRERERERERGSKGGWNIRCLEQTVEMWFLEAEEWLKRKRLNE